MIPSRTRAMSMLVIAFVLGLVVGGGVVVQAVRTGNAAWVWRGRGPRPGSQTPGATLDRRLHLGLDQAHRDSITAISCRGMAAIDSLLGPIRPHADSISARYRPVIDSLFQTVRPAIEARREQTRTEIRALLTPSGQTRYDSLNRAEDEQRKKQRDQMGQNQQSGPPGGGGGGGGGGPCPNTSGGPGPRGGMNRGTR